MYSQKDFSNLQFNPLCDGDIIKEYPKLQEIVSEALLGSPKLEYTLRYVIITCDPKSVVVLSERDLNYRKSIAADLAGVPQDEFMRNTMFSFEDALTLELSVRYLTRFAKSKEFAAILALETTYWESIRLLLKPIDNDAKDKEVLDAVEKKGKIKAEIDNDIKRLDGYYSSFFGEDKELEIKAKGRITPENARQLKK